MTPYPLTVGGFAGDVDVGFVVAMSLIALVVSMAAAGGYRLVQGERSPLHLPVTLGVGTVAVWMNSAATIVEYVERTVAAEPVLLQQMATNSVAVAFAVLASLAGARLGDLAASRASDTAATTRRVGDVVQSLGRFIVVTVPAADEIDDMGAFEPVPAAAKEALGGATFRFPRGLTVEELHARVVDRIRDDYQVGFVDLDLDETGTISRLAIGSRAAGLGPTLAPRKAAVGLPTGAAPGASPGDRIRVWRRGEDGPERVGPAELRATDDGVATVVMNEAQVRALDAEGRYELATLRSEGRPALEFASLIRAANETLRPVEVAAGSVLDGLPASALRLPVLAVRTADRGMVPVPAADTVLGAGDVLYVIGRHGELRRVASAASR